MLSSLLVPAALPGGQVLHLRWTVLAWPPSHAAFSYLQSSAIINMLFQKISFHHKVVTGLDYTL